MGKSSKSKMIYCHAVRQRDGQLGNGQREDWTLRGTWVPKVSSYRKDTSISWLPLPGPHCTKEVTGNPWKDQKQRRTLPRAFAEEQYTNQNEPACAWTVTIEIKCIWKRKLMSSCVAEGHSFFFLSLQKFFKTISPLEWNAYSYCHALHDTLRRHLLPKSLCCAQTLSICYWPVCIETWGHGLNAFF